MPVKTPSSMADKRVPVFWIAVAVVAHGAKVDRTSDPEQGIESFALEVVTGEDFAVDSQGRSGAKGTAGAGDNGHPGVVVAEPHPGRVEVGAQLSVDCVQRLGPVLANRRDATVAFVGDCGGHVEVALF